MSIQELDRSNIGAINMIKIAACHRKDGGALVLEVLPLQVLHGLLVYTQQSTGIHAKAIQAYNDLGFNLSGLSSLFQSLLPLCVEVDLSFRYVGRNEKLKFPSEIPYHQEVCANSKHNLSFISTHNSPSSKNVSFCFNLHY